MKLQLKEYDSAEELAGTIDKQISETKNVLGFYLQKLEEIRAAAEKSKKIREIMLKLAGKKTPIENLGEISVGSLNIVLDANPIHELSVLETVVHSNQERLLNLQKARDDLKWLDQLGDTEGLKYIVVDNEDIPERILFKIS
jgi:ribosome recycling factor